MSVSILIGDVRDRLRELPDGSVHCVVTSPPYFGLRDYGMPGQIGLEETPQAFVATMTEVFREVRRVLRDDGTLWLNLGDSYASGTKGAGGGTGSSTLMNDGREETQRIKTADASNARAKFTEARKLDCGLPDKNLIGIPWRVAFALQADGWYLRQDIIWSKPNPMPESVTDRCTKAHEYLFLLSKSARYHYDAAAIAEASAQPERAGVLEKSFSTSNSDSTLRHDVGRAVMRTDHRNKRSVWEVTTQPFSEAHFATFPPALIEPCIKAGCPKGGTVLDPFGGAGTTGLVADRLGRDAILIELNPEYAAIAERRIVGETPMFAAVLRSHPPDLAEPKPQPKQEALEL